MLPSPPNSTELKSSVNATPTQLVLPEPIEPVPNKKAGRKAPRRNHSEIERRRRERLNLKYNELRELVPACRAFRFARRGGDAGLHKLDILTEAVKYIGELEAKVQGRAECTLDSLAHAAASASAAPGASANVSPSMGPSAALPGTKHNLSYLMN